MPGSRITWIIGGALVLLIAVAGVDALRSPEDEATASPTTPATATPFSATTTVVTVMDKEAGESKDFVMNEAPDEFEDEGGNPQPDCSQDQLKVAIPPVRDPEGDGFEGTLFVSPFGGERAPPDCRQDYPYFRVALRDSRGQQLLVWSGRLRYSRGSEPYEPTFADFGPVPCQSWEVFPALVTVGYEPSPEGHASPLGCIANHLQNPDSRSAWSPRRDGPSQRFRPEQPSNGKQGRCNTRPVWRDFLGRHDRARCRPSA